MTTRPSNFVTLDWLMPLFNSQLSKLYEHWQSMEKKVGEAHAKEMAASYHEISGALRMANLPKHAKLADYLSRLSEELIDGDKLIADVAYWGAFANEGLQSEINHFAMTGGIRQSLIDKYVEEITHLLPPSAVMDANISSSDLETAPSQKEQTLSSQLSIPKAAHSRQLTQNHLNQLLMVWRQNVTQLLLENTNESAYLNTLQKVSRYLWEADVDGPLQTLWYLSSVWLHNLTRNVEPKPSQLASTLFELNQVIASMRQLTGQSENDTIKASEVDSQLSAITIDKLTAEVCIRLSVLLHTDETAQAILDDINSPHRIDQEFLPRILTKLEALILTLHEPAAIIEPLTKIKHQLTQRGWSLYGIYIDQVISDLEQSSHSEEIFAQLQWQIERQLQELYASILTAHDHIAEKIGQPTNFSTAFIVNQDSSFSQDVDHTANVSSFDALSAQSDQSAFHSTPDKIRQLRITVEDIKSDFNSYLQQQQSALLPSAQKFATIEQAFLEMGLADVSEISRNIGGLFERLRASDVNSMSWRLINTLAETLASLELFLDYLAQQVFDESLLNQVQEHMVEASFLLDSGDDSQDDSPTYHKSNLGDATRYDDNGEVVSSALTADEPAFEPSSVEIIPTESALAPVIEDLAADGTVITAPFTDQGTDIEQPLADYDKALTATEDEIEAADTHSFIDQPVSVTAVNEESVTGGPVIGATALEESDALKAARAELKDDDFGMDEEIREIFIEEAEEVLEQLNENLPIWQNNPQDLTPLTEIRRGFHTLKGSGRMVGAFNTGEMAWAVENMLNRVLDHTLPVTDELIGFITDTKDLIPTLVADFAQQMPPSIDPAVTVLKAKNLLAGDPINQGLSIDSAPYSIADNVSHDEESVDSDELDASSLEISESLGTMEVSETQPSEDAPVLEDRQVEGLPQQSTNLPEALEPFIAEAQNIPADADDADPDIKEIFIEEAEEVLAEITPIFLAYQPQLNDEAALTEVRRGFHTLKGSGRMVGAHYSAELAWAVESMLNRVLEHTITPTTDMMKLVADVLEAYPSLVDTFKEDRSDYPTDIVLWIACANAYSKGLGDAFGYPAVMQSGSTDLSQPTLSASLNDDSADTLADVNLQEVDLESAESSNNESHESSDDNQDNDGDYNAPSSNSPAYQDDLIEGQTDANDVTLQSIYSVNQKMAESPVLAPPQSEEEQQFCEIFIEEARERLETIKAFVHQNKEATTIAVDDQIVRDFHTLRGASGAKSLTAISDISAAIEHSLEQLQNNDAMMSAQHLKALAQSVDLIENYLNAYDLSPNQDALDNDQNQHDLQSIQALLEDPESDDTVESTLSVAHLMSEDIDELLDADWNLESRLTDHDLEQVQHYAQTLSEQIQSLMQKSTDSKKFQVLLGSLLGVYQQIQKSPTLGDDDTVVEALLAGHNQLTGLFDALAGSMSLKLDNQVISNLNELAKPEGLKDGLEPNDQVDKSKNTQPNEQVDASSQSTLSPTNQEAAELQSSNASMAVVSTEASSNEASLAADSAISLDIEAIETDAELLEIFLEEAQELDAEINRAFAVWRADPSDMEALKELQRHLHTIKGGARMAGIKSIGDLTHEAETVYEYFVANRLTPSLGWVNVMQGVQDTLSAQIDYVVNHHQSFYTETLVSEMQNFISQGELPDDARVTTPIVNNPNAQNLTQASDADAAIEEDVVPEHDYEKMVARSWGGDKPDPDILTVFLEEAEELVASSSENLQAFRSNTSDIAALQALQRELHTVKGGARMVSANGIADLAHQMETVYEELASRRRPATRMVSQLLVACHDWLADAVMILKHQIDPPMPTQLIAALEQFSASPDSLQEIHPDSLQAELDAIDDYISQQHSGMGHHDITEMPPMSGGFSQSDTGATISNNEMIRISAGLIERMINLTGESAINRARIDMGMSSLTNSIEEMGITVQRLADQLRRMDIELEAQILSQIDEEMLNDEDFDPLEMDQYSALNQLSKSLSESASDLLDIKSTLLEKTRDSESLLLQLSRTQAELQDGLMNSRMVPFSRLVPRLQRIVRQTASELGKAVELSIVNADDEMDRTILERITSPLEHMLRNAVDHGIESPEDRLAAGKSRAGQVRLEVMREGSEVVIHLTDDGNGINVDAVRRKAISQGLIDANDTSLSDVDVMQYIFNAGLTTTQKVTQISGRGVGMDVVRSEIRQLGGVVSVESSVGGGSRFTIRVPLTVAVSDALVVRAADRYYAIPLVQIERVVRINPEELYAYYQSDSSSMTIGDTGYRVRYLNEILTGHALNELVVSTNTSLPVIIIKSQTGQTLAIQVDEIAGSRIEVVVKPLGRQLSHVSGISAATIMGDGSVMLILDLIALMRNAPAQAAQVAQQVEQSKPAEAVIDTTTTILVVDDSVTVRKVTSRFLERQGLEAVVAKDGVDAIEILQELTPDLILLDIEMPRMDGFEVATQVRHDSRLKNIPIIMITSRTGEKHRERAMEIGVNDYMGKPFQENELLSRIQGLLGAHVGNQNDE